MNEGEFAVASSSLAAGDAVARLQGTQGPSALARHLGSTPCPPRSPDRDRGKAVVAARASAASVRRIAGASAPPAPGASRHREKAQKQECTSAGLLVFVLFAKVVFVLGGKPKCTFSF